MFYFSRGKTLCIYIIFSGSEYVNYSDFFLLLGFHKIDLFQLSPKFYLLEPFFPSVKQLKEQYDAATCFCLPCTSFIKWREFQVSPFYSSPIMFFPCVVWPQELKKRRGDSVDAVDFIKVDLQHLCIYACSTSCKCYWMGETKQTRSMSILIATHNLI